MTTTPLQDQWERGRAAVQKFRACQIRYKECLALVEAAKNTMEKEGQDDPDIVIKFNEAKDSVGTAAIDILEAYTEYHLSISTIATEERHVTPMASALLRFHASRPMGCLVLDVMMHTFIRKVIAINREFFDDPGDFHSHLL